LLGFRSKPSVCGLARLRAYDSVEHVKVCACASVVATASYGVIPWVLEVLEIEMPKWTDSLYLAGH